MLSQLSLDGKTIVVTGAGTGLGKEMALAIAQAGGNLILAARRMDRIEEVAEQARAAGVKAVAFSADLTNTNQVKGRLEWNYARKSLRASYQKIQQELGS